MPAKAAAAENIISLLLGSEGTKWLEATLERTPELLDVISPINTATTLQNKHTYMEFRGTSSRSIYLHYSLSAQHTRLFVSHTVGLRLILDALPLVVFVRR